MPARAPPAEPEYRFGGTAPPRWRPAKPWAAGGRGPRPRARPEERRLSRTAASAAAAPPASAEVLERRGRGDAGDRCERPKPPSPPAEPAAEAAPPPPVGAPHRSPAPPAAPPGPRANASPAPAPRRAQPRARPRAADAGPRRGADAGATGCAGATGRVPAPQPATPSRRAAAGRLPRRRCARRSPRTAQAPSRAPPGRRRPAGGGGRRGPRPGRPAPARAPDADAARRLEARVAAREPPAPAVGAPAAAPRAGARPSPARPRSRRSRSRPRSRRPAGDRAGAERGAGGGGERRTTAAVGRGRASADARGDARPRRRGCRVAQARRLADAAAPGCDARGRRPERAPVAEAAVPRPPAAAEPPAPGGAGAGRETRDVGGASRARSLPRRGPDGGDRAAPPAVRPRRPERPRAAADPRAGAARAGPGGPLGPDPRRRRRRQPSAAGSSRPRRAASAAAPSSAWPCAARAACCRAALRGRGRPSRRLARALGDRTSQVGAGRPSPTWRCRVAPFPEGALRRTVIAGAGQPRQTVAGSEAATPASDGLGAARPRRRAEAASAATSTTSTRASSSAPPRPARRARADGRPWDLVLGGRHGQQAVTKGSPQPDPVAELRFQVEVGQAQHRLLHRVHRALDGVRDEEYMEGGVNDFVHKLRGRVKFPNLVLKRGVTHEEALLQVVRGVPRDDRAPRHDDHAVRPRNSSSSAPGRSWTPSRSSGPARTSTRTRTASPSRRSRSPTRAPGGLSQMPPSDPPDNFTKAYLKIEGGETIDVLVQPDRVLDHQDQQVELQDGRRARRSRRPEFGGGDAAPD